VVLDLYSSEYNPTEPLIRMDEAAHQLLADVYEPVPMAPGQDKKEAYHYERQGV